MEAYMCIWTLHNLLICLATGFPWGFCPIWLWEEIYPQRSYSSVTIRFNTSEQFIVPVLINNQHRRILILLTPKNVSMKLNNTVLNANLYTTYTDFHSFGRYIVVIASVSCGLQGLMTNIVISNRTQSSPDKFKLL